MNKQTEALKMAIEVIQAFDNEIPTYSAKKAIDACKEALAEQEALKQQEKRSSFYDESGISAAQREFNKSHAGWG